MKLLARAACGLGLLAASIPALAESEQRRVTVAYHDLDLSRPEGVAELDRRVKRAVRRVCGSDGHAPWEREHRQKCIREAAQSAATQVGHAIAHARRAGKVVP